MRVLTTLFDKFVSGFNPLPSPPLGERVKGEGEIGQELVKRRISFILLFVSSLLLAPEGVEALLQANRIVFIREGPEENSREGTFTFPVGGVDLSQMGYLSFKVGQGKEKALAGPGLFVELRGKDGGYRVKASRFHRSATPSGEKIVIPLSEWRQIKRWDRILEIAVGFEGTRGNLKQELPIRDLLLGSNYPEDFKGLEIPMQNRVSSFKIDGRVASPEMKLKRNPSSLTLTLTFVDPYLEEIRFEESRDEGYTWSGIRSFFDHSNGGTYSTRWEPVRWPPSKKGVLVRAVGMNLWGGETNLAGPHRLYLD